MRLDDILTEAKDGEFDIKVRMSGADLNNIPDSLTYNITDVVLETKKGSVRIPKGGMISLDIGPEELAKKLSATTDAEAKEVINVQLKQPPSDFKYGSNKSTYSVTVEYVTEEGERESVDLQFNKIDFTPSKSVNTYLQNKM